MNRKQLLGEIGGFIIVTLLSICALRLVLNLHVGNIDELVAAAHGVIEGKPHWLAYQNRLLGPYITLLISHIGFDFKFSWKVYTALCVWIQGVILYSLLRFDRLTIQESISCLVFYLFLFVSFQNYWFYTWDSIDTIVFTLFAYGVLNSKPLKYFVILFIFGIANRESALFIALYIVINGFSFNTKRLKVSLTNAKNILIGICMLASGIAYIKFIRTFLFVSQPDGGQDYAHQTIGNHVYFFDNVRNLFFENFTNGSFIFSLILILFLSFFVSNFRRMNDSQFKCLLVILAIFFNVMIFGLVNETRMWFILIPFGLFLWLSYNGRGKFAADCL